MQVRLLKCKIHRATVTGADLNYEGSISIDPKLIEAAGLLEFEAVDIYNINNGQRLSTYVIYGQPGEICLNGAAARLVHSGDKVIIAAYAQMPQEQAKIYRPTVVMVNDENKITEVEKKVRNDIKSSRLRRAKPIREKQMLS